jgi:hypothetical protein
VARHRVSIKRERKDAEWPESTSGRNSPPAESLHACAARRVSAKERITNRAETSKPHPIPPPRANREPGFHDLRLNPATTSTPMLQPLRRCCCLNFQHSVSPPFVAGPKILSPKRKKGNNAARLTRTTRRGNMTSDQGFTGCVRVWTRRMNSIMQALFCFFFF